MKPFTNFVGALWQRLKHWSTEHSTITQIIVGVIVTTILGLLIWQVIRSDPAIDRTDPNSSSDNTPVVVFEPSPLTGVDVAPDLAARPVLAVMIENSPDARPQSGLDDAGVVFEAIAEAGITRFLALYQETSPELLGPIRSVRPYYLDWFQGFDAPVAHVGGSSEALSLIKSRGLRDLDQFFNAGAYYRASDRFAPHNMYSTYQRLADLMLAKNYTGSDFTPLSRRAASPLETPTASTINITISSSTYNVRYTYDPACNCYNRFMGGVAHTDRESGDQIAPSNVVVLKTSIGVKDSVGHLDIKTIGSGEAYIFRDGGVVKGTWSKSSPDTQIKLLSSGGEDVPLIPGNTWFTVISSSNNVTYTP